MSNQGVPLKSSEQEPNVIEYIASIDAGTSSVRVILFNKNGEIAFSEQKELTLETPKSGWVQQCAQEIYNNITECMKKLLSNNKIDIKQIKGVGITNQRETTIVWDASNGKPIYKAIVWQDTRTSEIVNRMSNSLGSKDALRSKCGLPISTYFSATKIKWLFENDKNVSILAKKNQLRFGTVDSWLIWNLLGNKTHLIDVTNASRTMLMNLSSLNWDKSLCDTFEIPMNILPKIVPSSYNFGIIQNGPFKGIPLTGCIGDQQGATLGQLCINPGDVKNTYGTGAFLIFNTGQKIVSSKHGLLTTVLWQFEGDKTAKYALEGSVAVAGQAVQFLRDNLGIINNAKECSDLAKQCDDVKDDDLDINDRVYFVTAFSGLYSPYWRNDARGLIYGLTMHTEKKTICRSVLEATCFRTCEIIEAMKQDTMQFGIKFNSLKVDGGMSQSDIMLQIQADLLQIPVVKPTMIETTALGAAIAAGLHSTIAFWENLNHVKHCIGSKRIEFEPSITKNKANKLKQGWDDAISRCFKNGMENDQFPGVDRKNSVVVIKEPELQSGLNGATLLGVMMGVLALSIYWGRRNNNSAN